MAIRRGRGVWWSLALAGWGQWTWNVPKWKDDVCSGLNQIKVTDMGGLNLKLKTIKNWMKRQSHPITNSNSMHISDVLPHQLLFHVCRTWGSWMLCLSACSSKKSNMYLMASGRALPRWAVLKMVSKRSSTNFCNVPWGRWEHSDYFQLQHCKHLTEYGKALTAGSGPY